MAWHDVVWYGMVWYYIVRSDVVCLMLSDIAYKMYIKCKNSHQQTSPTWLMTLNIVYRINEWANERMNEWILKVLLFLPLNNRIHTLLTVQYRIDYESPVLFGSRAVLYFVKIGLNEKHLNLWMNHTKIEWKHRRSKREKSERKQKWHRFIEQS